MRVTRWRSLLVGSGGLLPGALRDTGEVDRGLKAGHGDEVIKILELLQRLGEVIGLRFLVQQQLEGERLRLWLQPPSSVGEAMERFFLLYVQARKLRRSGREG
ncbi:unnamed protein product [Durusdinium trenchii]|uniref:Uncharacterized protein n=1 Tax=Durusdinium trenchii TaxID=1381693 RepID=A0ABP0J8T3_9DINO